MTAKFKLEEIVEFGGFLELTKELEVFMAEDQNDNKSEAIVKKPLKKGTLVKVHQLVAKNTVAMLEDINTQDRCLVKADELMRAIK